MAGTARTRARTRAPQSQRTRWQGMTDLAPLGQHQTSHPLLFVVIVGAAFLALWLVGLMMQIQTNEMFIVNGGNVDIYKPDWALFLQIPNLLFGNDNASEAMATIFGFGIELVYLGFIIGYEILQDSVERSGQFMAKLFKVLSWAIVVFNGWTDYSYGTIGGGTWGHIGFALIISFIVGFFGTIGMYLIQLGWQRS